MAALGQDDGAEFSYCDVEHVVDEGVAVLADAVEFLAGFERGGGR